MRNLTSWLLLITQLLVAFVVNRQAKIGHQLSVATGRFSTSNFATWSSFVCQKADSGLSLSYAIPNQNRTDVIALA